MSRYSVVSDSGEWDSLPLWRVIEWTHTTPQGRVGRTVETLYSEEAADSLAQALQWEEEQAIYAEFG